MLNYQSKDAITEYSVNYMKILLKNKKVGKTNLVYSYYLKDYKLLNLFKSFKIIDKDTLRISQKNLIHKKTKKYTNLQSLTSYESDKNNLSDYSLYIDKKNYQPKYVIKNPLKDLKRTHEIKNIEILELPFNDKYLSKLIMEKKKKK